MILGGVHDRHRRVVVDHDVGAPELPGRLHRVGLQIIRGGARPGGVGGAELGVYGFVGITIWTMCNSAP